MSSFVFNEAGFREMITDTTGGIANELEQQGERIVTAAQGYVGTQWPGGPSSPPQPFRRSGDLQASIHAIEPLVIGGVLQVQIWADAVHGGVVYPLILREKGFQFVDLESL